MMRDFQTYGRVRTLEQYCRDEAVDYKWLTKAQSQYGTAEKTTKAKAARRNNAKTPDMIYLLISLISGTLWRGWWPEKKDVRTLIREVNGLRYFVFY